MSDGTSSCRPARLTRFETTIDASCDGLMRRVGDLEDALATYRSSCGLEYRPPTYDTDGIVREFTSGLRDFGRWTGDVGRAFIAVDIVDAYIDIRGFDEESVISAPDDVIANHRHLEDWDDPFRGVAEGEADALADSLGEANDQDGPPSWLKHLEDGGTAADVASGLLEGTAKALADLPPYVKITLRVDGEAILLLRDGTIVAGWIEAELSATLRTPSAAGPALASTAKWIGRAGTILAGAAGFLGQWYNDDGLPTDERILRATTRGAGTALGGIGGGFLGGLAAGAVCGPGAPVCSTILGISGAILGGLGGDWVSGLLPWMDDEEPLPGERDPDHVEDVIAGIDNPIDPGLAASVDLMASDIARDRVSGDPFAESQVERLLPDREELENVIKYGTPHLPSPSPGPPTGTTTTTVPTGPPSPSPGPAPTPSPSPGPAPSTGTTTTLAPPVIQPGVLVDPWVTGHPWE